MNLVFGPSIIINTNTFFKNNSVIKCCTCYGKTQKSRDKLINTIVKIKLTNGTSSVSGPEEGTCDGILLAHMTPDTSGSEICNRVEVEEGISYKMDMNIAVLSGKHHKYRNISQLEWDHSTM